MSSITLKVTHPEYGDQAIVYALGDPAQGAAAVELAFVQISANVPEDVMAEMESLDGEVLFQWKMRQCLKYGVGKYIGDIVNGGARLQAQAAADAALAAAQLQLSGQFE